MRKWRAYKDAQNISIYFGHCVIPDSVIMHCMIPENYWKSAKFLLRVTFKIPIPAHQSKSEGWRIWSSWVQNGCQLQFSSILLIDVIGITIVAFAFWMLVHGLLKNRLYCQFLSLQCAWVFSQVQVFIEKNWFFLITSSSNKQITWNFRQIPTLKS